MEILESTRAELERAEADLAARAGSIRARIAGLHAAIEVARKEINDEKLKANVAVLLGWEAFDGWRNRSR